MTIFNYSDNLQLDEELEQPKRFNYAKLLVLPIVLSAVLVPFAANGQNIGRLFDAAQSLWGQFRQQQNGGAEPTQAQVDSQAREQARLDAARRAVGETREFYRSISTGNRSGVFDQVLRLIGEFGVMDPALMRQAGGTGGNPAVISPNGGGAPAGLTVSGQPTTVSEAVNLFNFGAIRPSMTIQTALEGVTGASGQKLLADQREMMTQVVGASEELAAITAEDAKVNGQIANENAGLIGRIESLGTQSQTRQASQDVLKDLANQQGMTGNLLGGLSLQQERSGNMLASLSGQLQLLSAQNNTLSFQSTQQLLTQAGMSHQLVQVEGEMRDNRNYQIARDQANQRNASMGQTVFIYGLNADPGYGLPVPTGSTLANLP